MIPLKIDKTLESNIRKFQMRRARRGRWARTSHPNDEEELPWAWGRGRGVDEPHLRLSFTYMGGSFYRPCMVSAPQKLRFCSYVKARSIYMCKHEISMLHFVQNKCILTYDGSDIRVRVRSERQGVDAIPKGGAHADMALPVHWGTQGHRPKKVPVEGQGKGAGPRPGLADGSERGGQHGILRGKG